MGRRAAKRRRRPDGWRPPRAGETGALELDRPMPLWGQLRQTAGDLAMHIRIVSQASPWSSVLLLILVFIEGALGPAQLWLVGSVIDRTGRELPVGLLATLAVVVGLTLAIAPLTTLAVSLIGDAVQVATDVRVVESINRWPGISRFEDPAFIDDLERVRSSAGWVSQSVNYVAMGLSTAVGMITAAALLARISPWIPILLVAAQLPAVALAFRFNNIVGSSLYVQAPQARHLSYLRTLALSPEVAKDVRLAGMFGFLRNRYLRHWSASVGHLARLRHHLGRQAMAAGLLGGGAAALGYAYAVRAATTGRLSLGELVTYAGAVTLLVASIGSVGFQLGFLPRVLAFLPAVRRIMTAPPDIALAADPTPVPTSGSGLQFDDVHFHYPGSPTDVLAGVSFALAPGQSLALVGHNGAGKTTIVKLLLRLYDPTRGRITFNGVDLRALDPQEYRRALSVVFQDFGRYELTLAENIGLGDLARMHDSTAVIRAAQAGHAADLADRLAHGYDTMLGRSLGETDLSGGQWQRVALARTFMRNDARLLVLDEPTAQLDPRAEAEVFERFTELTAGKMTVLVSHRFSTVRMADRIVVIEHGRVIEDGSHDELMARDREYARMYRIQASAYRDRTNG